MKVEVYQNWMMQVVVVYQMKKVKERTLNERKGASV
jgi:hypothetical protein